MTKFDNVWQIIYKNTKHIGPTTLPCGTKLNCLMSLEMAFLIFTHIFLSIRNDFNKPK